MDPKLKTEEIAENDAANKVANLQKRDYDLDATRYGDWELNGKCVDF